MGTVVVTGAAGFIGSSLCAALLDEGHQVRGIDRRDPATDLEAAANLAAIRSHPGLELHVVDLLDAPLPDLLDGAGGVAHLAGQPGVRTSWGRGFGAYADANVTATQTVLEAALQVGTPRVILASSSSVYGDVARGRAREASALAPRSPYGVTKLATEQLGAVYAARGLPVAALRYFTVYGPRQRADMAFHRIIAAALGGLAFTRRGDGRQVREFTYVGDAVAATVAALTADLPPEWIGNVGGGEPTSLRAAIHLVEELTGTRVPVVPDSAAPGDPDRTAADLRRTTRALGWHPTTPLRDGLQAQVDWQTTMQAASLLGA
jgi:nucleoside-diphosphate-sugar epimerase